MLENFGKRIVLTDEEFSRLKRGELTQVERDGDIINIGGLSVDVLMSEPEAGRPGVWSSPEPRRVKWPSLVFVRDQPPREVTLEASVELPAAKLASLPPDEVVDHITLPRHYFINGQAPGSIHPRNLVLELVLSLHPYVTEADLALERKDFLRAVATRILDDIGT